MDFEKLIGGIGMIDNDTIKVKLGLVSDVLSDYPIFKSKITSKIGNSIKDITYYSFV